MNLDRRRFIKCAALATGGSLTGLSEQEASAGELVGQGDTMGVLVDITNCIGCRKCEYACQESAGFSVPPIESFEDTSVFAKHRRPHTISYTTVNAFQVADAPAKPAYVKANCLHCLKPACASACLVGALQRQHNGAVTYDATKCMGCRYCMVACPFQIPAYDYDDPFTPQVRKCNFCFDRRAQNGGVPACVKICPNDALTYGKRSELLTIAHERIAAYPERYVNHVYGENEVGGTAWLYLASAPFDRLNFPVLGAESPAELTEAIQHGVFKFFVPPLALYALLGITNRLSAKNAESGPEQEASEISRRNAGFDGLLAARPMQTARVASTCESSNEVVPS